MRKKTGILAGTPVNETNNFPLPKGDQTPHAEKREGSSDSTSATTRVVD